MYPETALSTQPTDQNNNNSPTQNINDSPTQNINDSPTQNNNDSPAPCIFKIHPNFPFDPFHKKAPFSFYSKIKRKDKMINSKKLFLQNYNTQTLTKCTSQNNSDLIDRSKLKESISTINTFKHTHPQKETGRKRKLQPDSEDIAFQAKLIKTANYDQAKERVESSLEFDSKLTLRDNIVDVFN